MAPTPRRVEHRQASFEVPGPWKDEGVLTFNSPDKAISLSLVAVKAPSGASHDEILAQNVATLSSMVPGVEVHDTREVTLRAGRALSATLSFEDLGGTFVQRMLLVDVGQGELALLTGRCLAEHAMRLDGAFDQVTSTLDRATR